jgi:hypothetical protein
LKRNDPADLHTPIDDVDDVGDVVSGRDAPLALPPPPPLLVDVSEEESVFAGCSAFFFFDDFEPSVAAPAHTHDDDDPCSYVTINKSIITTATSNPF